MSGQMEGVARPARAPGLARARRRAGIRLGRSKWLVRAAFVVLLLSVVLAISVPLLSTTPLSSIDLSQAFLPPIWAGGTVDHVFGTDQLGRDILTRLGYGAGTSLIVGTASAIVACIGGCVLGVMSGYLGSWIDVVLSRLVDAQLAFPVILIGLALAVFMQPSLATVVLAVALTSWPTYARVVRSETLVIKHSEYVALARVSGLRTVTIMWRHVVPNVLPAAIILASQNFGQAVISESALSYLGIGIQPPQTSLGLMISEAQQYLTTEPWLVIAPTVMLTVLSLSANIVGDWLRERLDPTLRSL